MDAEHRALLMPEPPHRKLDAELEKHQLFDAKGDLLVSDDTVAGMRLPRGLTLHRSFEREWYFESKVASASALEHYFSNMLWNTEVLRGDGVVTFKAAQIKTDSKAPPVTVRISSVIGAASAAEVYILQAAPPPTKRLSGLEIEAEIRARREFAE